MKDFYTLISSDSELSASLPLYKSIAVVVYNSNNIELCRQIARYFEKYCEINAISRVVLLGKKSTYGQECRQELQRLFPVAEITMTNRDWDLTDVESLKIRNTMVIHLCLDTNVNPALFDQKFRDGFQLRRVVNQLRTAYYIVILPDGKSLFPDELVLRKCLTLKDFEKYNRRFNVGKRTSFCQEKIDYIDSFLSEVAYQDVFFQGMYEAEHGCEACNQCSNYGGAKHCPYAQRIVARFYREGMYVPQNPAIAHQWEAMAARQGFPEAEIKVADDLINGNGVKLDLDKAVDIYRRHAYDSLYCTRQLIKLAEEDKSLPGGLALPFISHHASAGNEEMILRLVQILQNGDYGLPVDANAALDWLEYGVDLGCVNCVKQAAQWYEDHRAWEKAYERYSLLFRLDRELVTQHKIEDIQMKMLTEDSTPKEIYIKGRNYLFGYFGKKRDTRLAYICLNHASNESVLYATGLLAQMYYYGFHVDKNRGRAKELLTKAVQAGDLRSLYFIYDQIEEEDKIEFGYNIEELLFKRIQEGLEVGKPYAYYLDGLCHYKAKYPEPNSLRGFANMKYAAEHGIPEAQYQLACMFKNGYGTSIDRSESKKWMTLAANNGSYEAKCYLGREYLRNEGFNDRDLALQYLKEAKEQCTKQNCILLAKAYLHARGSEEDKANAYNELIVLAEGGDSEAQKLLCEAYYNGSPGLEQNYRKAYEWGEKAIAQGETWLRFKVAYSASHIGEKERAKKLYMELANEGDASAMNNYACELSDIKEKIEWFRKAGDSGNYMGYSNLATYYRDGRGVEKDIDKAIELFKLAADHNVYLAYRNLARLYRDENSIEDNISMSIEWYRKAIDKFFNTTEYDIAGLMCELASVYSIHVTPANFTEALHYYKMAAEKGNKDALYRIGRLYEEGIGTPVDIQQAIYWYRKAANKDHVQAKHCLERLDANWLEKGKIKNSSSSD